MVSKSCLSEFHSGTSQKWGTFISLLREGTVPFAEKLLKLKSFVFKWPKSQKLLLPPGAFPAKKGKKKTYFGTFLHVQPLLEEELHFISIV